MYDFFSQSLEDLKNNDLYRTIKPSFFHEGPFLVSRDKKNKILNLSSNDYLGLSFDKSLLYEFISKIENEPEFYFLGSSGSRLLSGNSLSYERLELTLKSFYGKEALVLNSGYHANVGIISALFDTFDVIFFDKFCHASIIDGIKLSGARFYRYDHLDYDHLEKLLSKYRNNFKKAAIITESVFSMDGDMVDIESLTYLKEKYNCLLYIDEAHSVGVMGEHGLGLSFRHSFFDKIDIFLGTFGKAYGSVGSFVICENILKDYLVNKTRSFIYTTALPPISLSWTDFILNKSFYEFEMKREYLQSISSYTREKLSFLGLKVIGCTHIVPLIVGENNDAVILSDYLYENGIYAPAIRYPTVPKGSARIRFSLNSLIKKEYIDDLCDFIKVFYEKSMVE